MKATTRAAVLALAVLEIYLGLGLVLDYRTPSVIFDAQLAVHAALAVSAVVLWVVYGRHGKRQTHETSTAWSGMRGEPERKQ